MTRLAALVEVTAEQESKLVLIGDQAGTGKGVVLSAALLGDHWRIIRLTIQLTRWPSAC
jgi:hypothetical protein